MKIPLTKTVVISVLSQELNAATIPHSYLYKERELFLVIALEDEGQESEAQAVIDAHDGEAALAAVNAFLAARDQAETDAVTNFAILPDWVKEWTAADAAAYVHDNVLAGLDAAGVDAYVDALPSTVAGMKTGLKQIGGQLAAIRDILEVIAKLIMYIRDLVIRFRQ